MPFRPALLAAVAVATLLSGCRYLRPVDPSGEQPRRADASTEGEARQAAQPVGRLTDANIAAMVLALNHTDISYAQLVPARAGREDVKRFAERMITDHTGVNQLVNNLLAKIDVAAEDNTASLDMRDESAEKRDIMRELEGFAFDSAYIENEVSYHRKFLTQLDNLLLPAARHAELRGLLTSVRPAVASHLAHAEQVRADVLSKK